MSWEEMSTFQTVCPCGKGYITQNVYQMHGSQISVKTFDLNLPFAEIASQMDRIVETHFSGLTKAY